jgi:hypothetical protein
VTDFHGEPAFFFEKKSKMADSKKLRFSKLPILKNFEQKFHGLVLGLVELINVAQKQAKNAIFVFLGCFCLYLGQLHDQIG